MKKVLSFSLWGNNQTYTIGAIKNAELAQQMYPDFECWFYVHDETVPKDIIDQIKKCSNTKIIHKTGNLREIKPAMWRFEAIDDPDVEIMMCRDTDTRILEREVEAVKEWLESGNLFHIMRDHPHHTFSILAGMFGSKKIPEIKNWKLLMDKIVQPAHKNYDQDFLNKYIYPSVKNKATIHASFYKIEGTICKNFPSERIDYHHVGEYVYADESRSIEHINALKKY